MTAKQKQHLLGYMNLLQPEEVDGIWGPRSEAATAEAQRRLGIPDDGVWGDQTDAAIREYIYSGEDLEIPESTGTFWDHIRYWSREEFRCQCGGKYCNGFPAEPDQTLVELVDDIRHDLGAPGHRSSGLRCEIHNRNEGGVATSRHRTGKALDFMIEGKSAWEVYQRALSDPRTGYTYIIGNGPYVHVDVI